jgi:hypothetical protein
VQENADKAAHDKTNKECSAKQKPNVSRVRTASAFIGKIEIHKGKKTHQKNPPWQKKTRYAAENHN